MLFQKSVKCKNVFGHREHVLAHTREWHANFFSSWLHCKSVGEKNILGAEAHASPQRLAPTRRVLVVFLP